MKTYGSKEPETRVITLDSEKLPEELRDAETNWTFKRPTWTDNRKRSELWRSTEVVFDDSSEVRQRTNLTRGQIMEREMWLTFYESNMLGPEGNPLFTKGMNEAQFVRSLGILPAELVEFLYREMQSFVPEWGGQVNPT